ncbi:recombinase family protein [Antrihabitans stalactiti]|uniref:Recombinase family protein n=1 Tax=Antrihabitans stalactiti TaxID=2584121 RepID=A0A848KCA6_9NOCA|nr:recombinase family protein [Antrihabitans stalactiti]NMN94814.1 recombinase family protein [Antrihabitans stalactiti]
MPATDSQAPAVPGRRRRSRATAPANTCVAYTRVSTDEQVESGAGLAAQRAAIQAEADRRGWTIVAWHTDEGVSGGVAPARRTGLSAALAAVCNREAAMLVAAKLDRVSRSVADMGRLLVEAERKSWHFVTCDMAVDMSTPQGRAAAHMMVVFSELERGLISQRTRDALAVRKAAGVKLGKPTNVPDDVLRRIISEANSGVSLRKIAEGLMADGIPTGVGKAKWHAPQVQRALDCQRAQELVTV